MHQGQRAEIHHKAPVPQDILPEAAATQTEQMKMLPLPKQSRNGNYTVEGRNWKPNSRGTETPGRIFSCTN